MVPTYINQDSDLMSIIATSEELEIFNCPSLQNLIQFKWDEYGMRHHLIGCLMQLLQICILIFYVDYIYINNQINCRLERHDNPGGEIDYDTATYACGENVYAFILLGGIVYPLVYEIIHCIRKGFVAYILNISSIMDVVYILSSLSMSALHLMENPLHLASRIVMTGVILLSILRTFKFMRIFRAYSPIVTMLSNVIIDLQPFMLFYTTLIALFSLLWGTVGMGNLI